MGMMQISYWGASIGKQCQMNVCFPDRIETSGPLPVLYLLHGLSDDHTAWTRWTGIERYVARLPLIVAMPDGHRMFYTDAAEGLAYERNLIVDCVGTIDRMLDTRSERGGRCVSGLSMGGYGSMKVALKYPEMFVSVASHSSAFGITRGGVKREDLAPELERIFGKDFGEGGDDDCFALIERADRDGLPALRFDCGVDDFLIESNRAFDKHLIDLGIAHEYAEHPGAHTWDYWDVHIQESIAFHARHLGIEAQ